MICICMFTQKKEVVTSAIHSSDSHNSKTHVIQCQDRHWYIVFSSVLPNIHVPQWSRLDLIVLVTEPFFLVISNMF